MYFLFICNEPKRSYRLYAFMIQNIMRKFLSFRLQFHVILSKKLIVVYIKSDRTQAHGTVQDFKRCSAADAVLKR